MNTSESLVEIKTGLNPTESQLVLVKIHEQGIPAEIVDDNTAALLPHYALTSVGVKIVVPQPHAETAESILQQYFDDLNAQQEHLERTCPKCGSEDTKVAKSNIFTNLLGFIFLLPTRTAWSKRRICNSCGHKW